MIDAQDWLPADTSVPPALDGMIANVVVAWGDRWFSGQRVVVRGMKRRGSEGGNWRGLNAGMMVHLPADGVLAVGARALDVPPFDRSAGDREILEAVGETCLSDLQHSLAVLVGAAADSGWSAQAAPPSRTAEIDLANGTAIILGLSYPAFARLARKSLDHTDDRALGDPRKALTRQPVRVGAAIGRASLSLADVQALGVGDVVVLDHAIEDPAPLTVDHVALASGRCAICADPIPHLQITQALVSVQ